MSGATSAAGERGRSAPRRRATAVGLAAAGVERLAARAVARRARPRSPGRRRRRPRRRGSRARASRRSGSTGAPAGERGADRLGDQPRAVECRRRRRGWRSASPPPAARRCASRSGRSGPPRPSRRRTGSVGASAMLLAVGQRRAGGRRPCRTRRTITRSAPCSRHASSTSQVPRMLVSNVASGRAVRGPDERLRGEVEDAVDLVLGQRPRDQALARRCRRGRRRRGLEARASPAPSAAGSSRWTARPRAPPARAARLTSQAPSSPCAAGDEHRAASSVAHSFHGARSAGPQVVEQRPRPCRCPCSPRSPRGGTRAGCPRRPAAPAARARARCRARSTLEHRGSKQKKPPLTQCSLRGFSANPRDDPVAVELGDAELELGPDDGHRRGGAVARVEARAAPSRSMSATPSA